MSDLWDVKAVAGYIGVSASTVYRYAEKNDLPHIKKSFGLRFRKEDIDSWLEKDKRKHILPPCIPDERCTKADNWAIYKWGGTNELMAKAKSKTRYNFGYGAIYQRKMRRGKIRWYIDYRDADGRRVQKVASSRCNKGRSSSGS